MDKNNLCQPLRLTIVVISIFSGLLVTACSVSPAIKAQERLFLDVSLEFLAEYRLPKMSFQDTPVGDLSAISYDQQQNRFYALSDDRSLLAPARFYTLNIIIQETDEQQVKIEDVEVEAVTFLKNKQGETYTSGSIDPEGIALSPRNTLFISSEGVSRKQIMPFIKEFNPSGMVIDTLPLPQRYLPKIEENSDKLAQGIQDNLGFEALTINHHGLAKDDPFRLFTATEYALIQDVNSEQPQAQAPIRLMHYVINPIAFPILVAEHLYLLEPDQPGTLSNGLSELLTLEQEGYLLSLERTFGLTGAKAKIFQVAMANATDISNMASLKENISQIVPVHKKLVLDLDQLNIELDNLEGMTFGPSLKDGSRTLLLISDDNFSEQQVTQILLFKLSY